MEIKFPRSFTEEERKDTIEWIEKAYKILKQKERINIITALEEAGDSKFRPMTEKVWFLLSKQSKKKVSKILRAKTTEWSFINIKSMLTAWDITETPPSAEALGLWVYNSRVRVKPVPFLLIKRYKPIEVLEITMLDWVI